jgi:hypothetical protein
MYEMIRIPEPCAANWEAMTPEGKGRHCGQCCKTVVDFTQWENEDILAYLKKHASAGICGHFRKQQLNTPIPTPEIFIQHVNHSFLSFTQKIAVVFLFVFGIMAASCGNTAQSVQASAGQQAAQFSVDTTSPQQMITGDTITPPPPPEQIMQGEAIAVPEPEIGTGPGPGPVMGGAPVIERYPVMLPPVQDSTKQQDSTDYKDTI